MSYTFTNLTRANEIGANSYELKLAGHRLLLDAGLHPRAEENVSSLPQFGLVPDGKVEAIILTHAHQDHIGALPVAMRRHPKAPVFMTSQTAQIGEIMLHNSVNVMSRRKEEGTGQEVLFSHREIDQASRRWRPAPLHQRFDLAGERIPANAPLDPEEIAIQFFDAGHVLGSAGALIECGERAIFYTGDVNFEDQTIMRAARFPERPLDTLIVETTRGDHATPAGFTRRGEELRFGEAIQATLDRGGSVLVPVFALGKTQEVLAMLLELIRLGVMQEAPIYIGGLSTKLTEVYDRPAKRGSVAGAGGLKGARNIFTMSGPEAFSTRIKPGRIYALSSGMMTEQTLSHQLAPQFLSDPKHSIYFVGYADPDSPAGRLRQTPREGLVPFREDADPLPVRCEVQEFSFSGHAKRESIRAYINRVRPKNVILVHGDLPALAWFREAIAQDLPGSRVIIPEPGVALEIE